MRRVLPRLLAAALRRWPLCRSPSLTARRRARRRWSFAWPRRAACPPHVHRPALTAAASRFRSRLRVPAASPPPAAVAPLTAVAPLAAGGRVSGAPQGCGGAGQHASRDRQGQDAHGGAGRRAEALPAERDGARAPRLVPLAASRRRRCVVWSAGGGQGAVRAQDEQEGEAARHLHRPHVRRRKDDGRRGPGHALCSAQDKGHEGAPSPADGAPADAAQSRGRKSHTPAAGSTPPFPATALTAAAPYRRRLFLLPPFPPPPLPPPPTR